MKKDLVAVTFLALMLFVVGLAGCRPFAWNRSSTVAAESLTAYAGLNPVYWYYGGGLGLMITGAIVFAFGGRIAGATLAAFGAGIAYFGHTLILYPWIALVAILAVAAIAAFIGYDRWKKQQELSRNENAVKELVAAVQRHPEVKADIGDGDPVRQEAIRPLVNTAKSELRREGVIV